LSVQITVVDPSVSTLASRRTSMPRDANRHAPADRKRVRTIGNSSGIAAIARLAAPSNARVQGSPRAMLSPNSAIATMTATTPRRRTRMPAFCCSELADEALCATRAAMPPY
jgi:hypothetical protein